MNDPKMPRKRPWVAAMLPLCALVTALGGPACGDGPDAASPVHRHGRSRAGDTVGEAIYQAMCMRVAAFALPDAAALTQGRALCKGGLLPEGPVPAKLLALHEERGRLVAAVNSLVAEGRGDAWQALLEGLLPLHDDGTIARTVAAVAAATAALSQDSAAAAAMASCLGGPATGPGLGQAVWPVLAGPEAPALAMAIARIAAEQPDAWDSLSRAAAGLDVGQIEQALAALGRLLLPLREPLLQAGEPSQHLRDLVEAAAAYMPLTDGLASEPLPLNVSPFWAALEASMRWGADVRPLWPTLSAQALHVVDHRPGPVRAAIARLCAAAELPAQEPGPYAPAPTEPGPELRRFLAAIEDWFAAVARQPGLSEDLLAALGDPHAAALAFELGQQMRHSDPFDFDPTNVNGAAVGAWRTPVVPGSAPSTFARLLALVAATHHQRLCSNALEEPMPEYATCGLFEVPDVAAFYVQSLAGAATLTLRIDADDFFFPDQFAGAQQDQPDKSEMEAFTGIDGFVRVANPRSDPAAANHLSFRVSPKGASRLLMALHDPRVPQASAFGQARAGVAQVTPRMADRSGVPLDEAFAGTLFAWEAGAFVRGMRPVAQAFVGHGHEQLLLDLMGLLHAHWAPLLAENPGFEHRLGAALQASQNIDGAAGLLQALQQAPAPVGQHPLAPWAAVLRAGLTRPPEGGLSPVMRLLVTPSPLPHTAAPAASADARAQRLAQAVLPVLRALLRHGAEAHVRDSPGILAGAPHAWGQAGDTMAAALAQDPDTTVAIKGWLARLLTQHPDDLMAATVAVLQGADGLPRAAPWAVALGRQAHGPSTPLQPLLEVMRRTAALDVPAFADLWLGLVAAPAQTADSAAAPMADLWQVFARINRPDPSDRGPLSGPDLAAVLGQVHAWLVDDEHGLPRLLQLVAQRGADTGRGP